MTILATHLCAYNAPGVRMVAAPDRGRNGRKPGALNTPGFRTGLAVERRSDGSGQRRSAGEPGGRLQDMGRPQHCFFVEVPAEQLQAQRQTVGA